MISPRRIDEDVPFVSFDVNVRRILHEFQRGDFIAAARPDPVVVQPAIERVAVITPVADVRDVHRLVDDYDIARPWQEHVPEHRRSEILHCTETERQRADVKMRIHPDTEARLATPACFRR